MYFWYVFAFLFLQMSVVWFVLDFLDMRAARKNGQHVVWYEGLNIGVHCSRLGVTVLLFIIGMRGDPIIFDKLHINPVLLLVFLAFINSIPLMFLVGRFLSWRRTKKVSFGRP